MFSGAITGKYEAAIQRVGPSSQDSSQVSTAECCMSFSFDPRFLLDVSQPYTPEKVQALDQVVAAM